MRGAPVVIDRCLECHVRVRRRRLGQQVDGVGVGHDPVRVHPPQPTQKDGTRRVGLADGLLVRAAKCRRGPTGIRETLLGRTASTAAFIRLSQRVVMFKWGSLYTSKASRLSGTWAKRSPTVRQMATRRSSALVNAASSAAPSSQSSWCALITVRSLREVDQPATSNTRARNGLCAVM